MVPTEHPITAVREWLKTLVPGSALIVAVGSAYYASETFSLAKSSAERQQRAYVMMATNSAYFEKGKPPYFWLTAKNFGQTPAFDVNCRASTTFGPYPRPAPPDKYDNNEYKTDIPPGSEKLYGGALDRALTDQEWEDVLANKAAVYLDVVITYRDIFGQPRVSKYHTYANTARAFDNHYTSGTGEGDYFK